MLNWLVAASKMQKHRRQVAPLSDPTVHYAPETMVQLLKYLCVTRVMYIVVIAGKSIN